MSFSRAGMDPTRRPGVTTTRPQPAAKQTNFARGASMLVSQDAVTKADTRSHRGHGETTVSRKATADHLASSAMVPMDSPKKRSHRHAVSSFHTDAQKDHILMGDDGMCTRPSARLRRPAGAYKRRNPNVQSAFEESKVKSSSPRFRKPLQATPWAHDLPSARGPVAKVYPKTQYTTTSHPRRKLISTHPAATDHSAGAAGGGAPNDGNAGTSGTTATGFVQHTHQGKKHMGVRSNDESKPVDPPVRPKNRPVAPKYQSTLTLKFSPRMTPRTTKVVGQKPKLRPLLSWDAKNQGGETDGANKTDANHSKNSPSMPVAGVKNLTSPLQKKSKPRTLAEDPISGLSPTAYHNSGYSQVEYERKHTGYGGDGALAGCDDKRARTKRPAQNTFLASSHVFSSGASPPNSKTEEKRSGVRMVATSTPQPSFAAETASHKGKKRAFTTSTAAAGAGAPSSRTGAPNATRSVAPWADAAYTRSPFDPGSARGVKPHSNTNFNLPPRRHADPNA